MTLAYGLVWCKDCQTRTALAAAGGRCPVCDPSQVNEVAARAQDELDRIDQVLAGADDHSWADEAEWAADGSHQDDDVHAGFVESFLTRRVVRRSGRSAAEALTRAFEDVPCPSMPWLSLSAGTHSGGSSFDVLGYLDGPVVFGFDGEREDTNVVGTALSWDSVSMTVRFAVDAHENLLRLFWGGSLPDERADRFFLDRWADDGGRLADSP